MDEILEGQKSIDDYSKGSEQTIDEELWTPMIASAIREFRICLESLETRADHNDSRIALNSIRSVAKRSREVSDSLYRVLAVHEEYQQLLSLFQKHS